MEITNNYQRFLNQMGFLGEGAMEPFFSPTALDKLTDLTGGYRPTHLLYESSYALSFLTRNEDSGHLGVLKIRFPGGFEDEKRPIQKVNTTVRLTEKFPRRDIDDLTHRLRNESEAMDRVYSDRGVDSGDNVLFPLVPWKIGKWNLVIGNEEVPTAYMLMPYFPSLSLEELNRQVMGVSLERVIESLGAVAPLLDRAKESGVINADIKPHHIWIPAHPQNEQRYVFSRAILGDWDSVKVDNDKSNIMAESGAWLTYGYAPPELLDRKNPDVGPSSHVFMLGATIYNWKAGKRLYREESWTEFADASSSKHWSEYDRKLRNVRDPLMKEIRQAVHPNPQARHDSALEFVDALKASLQ